MIWIIINSLLKQLASIICLHTDLLNYLLMHFQLSFSTMKQYISIILNNNSQFAVRIKDVRKIIIICVHPFLEYGYDLCRVASKHSLASLDTFQKRIIRLINDSALAAPLDLLVHWRSVSLARNTSSSESRGLFTSVPRSFIFRATQRGGDQVGQMPRGPGGWLIFFLTLH